LDKGFWKFIKENKKLIRIAVLVSVGLILIFASGLIGGGNGDEKKGLGIEEYKAQLEAELESLCHSVTGVGRCRVYVTFVRGELNTYKGSTVIETKPPEVLGVTVVCDGGESDRVKRELVDMLTALFNIGSNRVAILKLNS